MLVPRKEYHEWVAMFVEGRMEGLSAPLGQGDDDASMGLAVGAGGAKRVLPPWVEHYLHGAGEWAREEAPDDRVPRNPELGSTLLRVMQAATAPEVAPTLPDLSGELSSVKGGQVVEMGCLDIMHGALHI